MRKIRVAFIIPSLVRGGAEGQLCGLIRGLDRDLFEPTLVLFEEVANGYPHDNLDCDVHILGAPCGQNRDWLRQSGRHLSAFTRLYRALRNFSPDVVHANLPAATILGCPAAWLARVPTVIAGRRSLFFYRENSSALAVADRYSLRFADAVTTNCKSIAEETIKQDKFPRDRVYVVENGVDCARFRPGGDPKLRDRFGWTPDHVVFGMIANFYSFKRHVDFLHAAAAIHRTFPHSRFVLVGREEDAYTKTLRLRSQLGLDQVVAVLPSTNKPEAVYAALDVYVTTSSTEGLSNVLLEAMACGLPAIATAVGGNPDIVTHGVTGFLVPAFSPGDVAGAARILASDRELRRSFGNHGMLLARRRFSLERMVREHEDLYRSLVRQHSPVATPCSALPSAHLSIH